MGLGAGLLITVGVAAGAYVVGKAVKYIADEMSAAERERQRELQDRHHAYMSSASSRLNAIHSRTDASMSDLRRMEREERRRIEEQLREEKRVIMRQAWAHIKEALDEHKKERQEFLLESKKTLSQLKGLLKNNDKMLRKENLTFLIQSLEETISKVKAHIKYLERYESTQLYQIKRANELLAPFSFRLPEAYPYEGKLFKIKKANLSEFWTETVAEGIEIHYTCEDVAMLEMFDDEMEIPVLIDGFKAQPHFAYTLSVSKGFFKNCALYSPGIGFEAEVIRHERSYLQLDYHRLLLRLPKEQLENPRHLPPRGSKIRVFPKSWTYNLYFEPIVTEKYQESIASIHFQNLPFVMKNEQFYDEFLPKYEEYELGDVKGNWKVAPLDEAHLDNGHLKFQLGIELVMEMKLVMREDGRPYFQFVKLLSADAACKPDEIFVPISATMLIIDEEDVPVLENEEFQVMADLNLFLTREFGAQATIKESTEGMTYFNKWAELTDELITYKYKGKQQVEVELSALQYAGRDRRTGIIQWKGIIENVDQVKAFLSSQERFFANYFVESSLGDYHTIVFNTTAEVMYIYGEFPDTDKQILTVYLKEFPYPEIQQKQALNVFREGRLANPVLQPYLLNAASVESEDETFPVTSYFNPSIAQNAVQKDAVERALSEKHFFMIQGPPGTGKTTVIQEIVLQYLTQFPTNRVLIVSQANVAVDNVLVDLYEGEQPVLPKEYIVRCGRTDMIDDTISTISFEQKYQQYIDTINTLEVAEEDVPYFNRWKQFVDHHGTGYNPQIAELILRQHQVIGATCVGLAQRSIGLDRLTFDLVIIDEAGKALPGEMLIPLNRAKKVILIGDHKQLPPTVDTSLKDPEKIDVDDREYIEEELFSKSLFYHLYESCPDTNKVMLETQYRMANIIGDLISELFYDHQLQNGDPTYGRSPIVFEKHINWLDMSHDPSYHETDKSVGSPRNYREAQLVVDLVLKVREFFPIEERIAVITPYKGQKREIIGAFSKMGQSSRQLNVAINTIDAFQGDEAKLVLYCTTRSKRPTDFFSDNARLNVALSRTKSDLLIIGSTNYFKKFGTESKLTKIFEYTLKHGQVWSIHNLQNYLTLQAELEKERELVSASWNMGE